MKLRDISNKLGTLYANYRLNSGRGGIFTAEIMGIMQAMTQGGVIILLLDSYFHIKPPIWIIPIIWIIQKSFETFMGWLDREHLHWWQKENNLAKIHTEPFLVAMDDKLKKILEKLNEK